MTIKEKVRIAWEQDRMVLVTDKAGGICEGMVSSYYLDEVVLKFYNQEGRMMMRPYDYSTIADIQLQGGYVSPEEEQSEDGEDVYDFIRKWLRLNARTDDDGTRYILVSDAIGIVEKARAIYPVHVGEKQEADSERRDERLMQLEGGLDRAITGVYAHMANVKFYISKIRQATE